ncbi:hypothetical protein PUNSTDRAFT_82406 [Punctularia strigosozonata HHB-11173 SS5]|uniref:uncharacterized protein n=1 Tax=Punctularia strigosozonata (strain HHB-11173) TaxID=741275 RepID=UPI0004416AE8|nr:uncharacterized protein PUNSTDRAFT_82406 [Punctularia strigosozonata HHB-11173 SS5]EIN12924.1 hypothetical protein PUNSTDRAFT_82406 [Punctularia strigosozonata HHB-11173 SS5]
MLFIKNTTRNPNTWKRLEKSTRDKLESRTSSPSSGEDEDGLSTSRVRSNRNRKRTKEAEVTRLKWEKLKEEAALVISDSDDSFLDVNKTEDVDRWGEELTHKRKRGQRDRSRSITPPPALPQATLQHAREIIRQVQALDGRPRAYSPTIELDDDSDGSIQLDPELAAIQKNVRLQAALPPAESGGPTEVVITVKWKPHPAKGEGNGRQTSWIFRLKRYDTLRAVFEGTADEADMLVDNVVLMQDGIRVFPSSTPHGLNMWAEGELEACNKQTFEYLRTHRNTRGRSPSIPPAESHGPPRSPSLLPFAPSEQDTSGSDLGSDTQESASDTFKIVLRAEKAPKDVILLVRPTTLCSTIVAAFLKANGLVEQYPDPASTAKNVPHLVVDGDRMPPNAPISDADLEEGDMVEVAGL